MSNLAILNNQTALSNLEKFAQGSTEQSIQYLKFTKNGQFVFGIEDSVVDEDELFAANMDSLAQGFICWKDNKVVGEEMARMSSGTTVSKGELPDIADSDGWTEQMSVEFQSLDTGETLLFKTSSFGGKKALAALSKAFIDNLKRGSKTIVPVVAMVAGSYKHEKYGKIFTPHFEVDHWLGSSDVMEAEDAIVEVLPADDVVVEEQPVTRRRRKAASSLS